MFFSSRRPVLDMMSWRRESGEDGERRERSKRERADLS
jgi:hypothetical protein